MGTAGIATEKKSTIPTRDQIDDRFKWNLGDLFPTDDAWETEFKQAQKLIAEAGQFAGKLAESPQTLYNCLKIRSDLGLLVARLYQYAKLSQDLDNRVSKYQAMTDRSAMLASQSQAAFAYVEPELLTIEEKVLLDMAGKFPRIDEYDLYIRELIRTRQHIRSQEVEELLAMSAMATRGPGTIFTMLDDADLVYPTIKDENGDDLQLTKQRYAKLMESPDRRVRRDAYNGFYSVYKEHLNTLSASLAAAVNADLFYARARRFDSCLESALFGDNIPTSVYHALLDTTEANLEGLNRYTAVRKRILGVDEFRSYDLICPLFPDQAYEVEYDDAIKEILQALQPLGEKYIEVLHKAFASRWVDVYETAGKGSGAYSWGNYSTHPFVLMNYNKTVDNMFTLAHEMGHALHSYLSNKTQPYPKAQYSIFVAEVASTLNEGLLLQHLLRKAADKKQKLYLLNRYIDNTARTFFSQILFGRFELMIHETVEKGGALSPDLMAGFWTDLTRKYDGPALTLDEYSGIKWCRIPHFYLTFYVYQYATSYAASQAILDGITEGDNDMIDRYLTLLSSGGSDYPIELLKKCGVDMSTPVPVEATLRRFAEQVDELDKLTQE